MRDVVGMGGFRELRGNCRRVGEPRVVDVVYCLGKQNRDVLVVQFVDRQSAIAHAAHKAEVAQEPELVRDERLLEPDAYRQSAYGTGAVAETR
jgi:hypothetical protein